jgi:glucose/arabinose dehydrogenase
MRRLPGIAAALLVILASALAAAMPALAEPALPDGFQDSVAFGNLEQPTAVRFAPNGMVFVAEKAGKIKVYEDLGDETPEVFKDLRTAVYDHGDRGLLGLAVDPEFPTRPYVYALFTYDHILGESAAPPRWGLPNDTGDTCPELRGADDCLVSGRLVRYTASVTEDGEGHLHAAVIGEQALIPEEWCQQFSSHSIGDLRFGPEGALYVSGGDGASFSGTDYGQLGEPPNPCGDPPDEGGSFRSQDLQTPASPEDPTGLNGSVIRIDPDTGEAWPGNPLAASTSANERRIVGYGFRNPFRFTLRPGSDEVYVGNVGGASFEEIDRFDPSAAPLYNSGWPCYEGPEKQYQFKLLNKPICNDLYADPSQVATPLFYYSHAYVVTEGDHCYFSAGSAISGLSFYEGEQFPAEYKGALFFADPVRGCFYAMLPGAGGEPDPTKVVPFLTEGSLYPGVDIEEGPDGALYYASLFGVEFSDPGAIHRIGYEPEAPKARLAADKEWGPTPLEVHLDAGESSDPNAEPLEFEWDLDGNGTFEKNSGSIDHQTVTFTQAELEEKEAKEETLNVVVAVRVKDEGGHSSVARLTIYPGDEPPTMEIDSPSPGLTWHVGQTIHFHGTGHDAEGNPLYGASLYWSTRIYHCPTGPENCHAHPLQVFPGVREGNLIAPEHDYPSYLEITGTTADERGLTGSKTIRLNPETVQFQLASSPSGIGLNAGVVSAQTPFAITAIKGSNIVLGAPEEADLGGKSYAFQSWSDGGARIHSVLASGSRSFTATFAGEGEPVPTPPTGTRSALLAAPPRTRLLGHPAKRTAATLARFGFASNPVGAGFRCKLDGRARSSCRSPKTYRRLPPGRHTFKVWAVSGSLTDPTPAKFSWKVLPR